MAKKNRKTSRQNRGVASIPAKGRSSHIMARNVMRGDAFCLNGKREGSVEMVARLNTDAGEIGCIMLGIRTDTGNVFGRSFKPDDRVWIHETPDTYRRRQSLRK